MWLPGHWRQILFWRWCSHICVALALEWIRIKHTYSTTRRWKLVSVLVTCTQLLEVQEQYLRTVTVLVLTFLELMFTYLCCPCVRRSRTASQPQRAQPLLNRTSGNSSPSRMGVRVSLMTRTFLVTTKFVRGGEEILVNYGTTCYDRHRVCHDRRQIKKRNVTDLKMTILTVTFLGVLGILEVWGLPDWSSNFFVRRHSK